MSGIWIQVIQFIMALSLLIVLHEGGHFFFARLFKTRVEKFYLFFDFLFPFSNILPFSLFKKKIGETQWGIGWFPLGGYVKIAGMVDESMDKEQLAKPPEPWEFRAKKPWQRLLIMLGGIIVNVILAFLIYAMLLFAFGKERVRNDSLVQGIMVTDSLGYRIGFQDGDKILAVDNKTYTYFDEIRKELLFAKNVEIERDGVKKTIELPIDWKGKIGKSGVFSFSIPYVIKEFSSTSGAQKAGMQVNDRIVSINEHETPNVATISQFLLGFKNKTVDVGFIRNGSLQHASVLIDKDGKLGVKAQDDFKVYEKLGLLKVDIERYGFFESFPAGVKLGAEKIKDYWRQLGLIINFKNGTYKQVGGFASMASIYSTSWDWEGFWNITAFISIALAIMNLLPIPGLDGGYVVFTLIEMITGRKVNEKVMEVATTIGLVLLLILMVVVNGNDVLKMFK
jgi:regulator of sigma E protease